jgi:hypothetical protein
VIRWLEGNPVGMALASVSGGLLLVSLLIGVIWSLPPSPPAGGPQEGGDELSLNVPQLGDSEPIEKYEVITERPVFSESRQPQLALESDEDDSEDLPEEEVDAPDVELAGVVITPSIRMVTLRQKKVEESLIAFEGQPLEGDYGSWHVSRIEPREITLSSGDGEEMQLFLQIHDVKIEEPAKPEKEVAEAPGADQGESPSDGDQPLSRAEEIRQRIAERREELRRAAEAEDQDPAETVNYRNAIQSMVRKKPPEQTEEDDQQ